MFTILSLTWDRPRRYHKEEISLSKKGTQREKLILSSGTIVTSSEPMYTLLVRPDFMLIQSYAVQGAVFGVQQSSERYRSIQVPQGT